MFYFSIMASLVLFFSAACILWGKYRIIIGGELCDGKISGFAYGQSSKGVQSYIYVVTFIYEGEEFTKLTTKSTTAWSGYREQKLGKPMKIYYNPNHPNNVAIKDIGSETLSLFLILLGVLWSAITYGVWKF